MLRGTITALVTPFDETGAIDEAALRRLVSFQIEDGVNGLLPCGTTGESPTLSYEEHNRVINIVIDEARGRVPVIAGTGSNSTREAIELTEHALKAGADYSLQVAPYYNKPTQKGLYEHFLAIAEAVDIPLIIYNIPGRTGKNIETKTIVRLTEHKNIIGLKEASGDINQMMDVIQQCPPDFAVFSGDDNLTYPLITLGGAGVISVASNIIPRQVCELVNAGLEGQWTDARERHYDLLPVFKAFFLETNPIPVKTALAMKGMMKEVFRSPMCSMEPDTRARLEAVLREKAII
ncbi:MAG TPA: 4-hydroxy-tetrahydrodipicolinate synthase [Thermodesulfobacteriota bacterium]|nr:4-hydroxy-tetrahydrodipicolinate synthase [Deltaproteobacteria bacterium]HNR14904.1 4-hydroxy-tetrahydrodipicolinate synthase [Thermodesulfobacteriota bacterium]HNU72527.1 4-hydroxy-tetrahydrodipicolinate synthase [Thermodesulfobacteriota bacterium]